MLKSVCLFCGSSAGRDPVYGDSARAMGRELAERGIRLVYGGGRVGLMGAVADAVLAAGGEAVGVIPRSLQEREVGHTGLSELHVVETMHQRKALMAELAGAFIAMPGGIGTLEELFEIWTWGQLGIHRKPLGLLNVAGFFDPLLAFLEHIVDEGFLRAEHRASVAVESTPAELLRSIEAVRPPEVEKWIDLTRS